MVFCHSKPRQEVCKRPLRTARIATDNLPMFQASLRELPLAPLFKTVTGELGRSRTRFVGSRSGVLRVCVETGPPVYGQRCPVSTLPSLLTRSRGEYLGVVGILVMVE